MLTAVLFWFNVDWGIPRTLALALLLVVGLVGAVVLTAVYAPVVLAAVAVPMAKLVAGLGGTWLFAIVFAP